MTHASTLQDRGWNCIEDIKEILANGNLHAFCMNTKVAGCKQYFVFGEIAWYKAQLVVNVFEDKIEIPYSLYKTDYSKWFRVDYGNELDKSDNLAQDILKAISENIAA